MKTNLDNILLENKVYGYSNKYNIQFGLFEIIITALMIFIIGFYFGYMYFSCECNLTNCIIEKDINELKYKVGSSLFLNQKNKISLMKPKQGEFDKHGTKYTEIILDDDITSEINTLRIYEELNRTYKK